MTRSATRILAVCITILGMLALSVPTAVAGHEPENCAAGPALLVVANNPPVSCSVTLVCPQNFAAPVDQPSVRGEPLPPTPAGHRFCVWDCTVTIVGIGWVDDNGCGSSCPVGVGLPLTCTIGPIEIDVNEGESQVMTCSSEGITTAAEVTIICNYALPTVG